MFKLFKYNVIIYFAYFCYFNKYMLIYFYYILTLNLLTLKNNK